MVICAELMDDILSPASAKAKARARIPSTKQTLASSGPYVSPQPPLPALAIDLALCSVVSVGCLDPLNGGGGAGRE